MRGIIFLVIIITSSLFFSSHNQEIDKTTFNTSRPIKLFIISDANNTVANERINSTLEDIQNNCTDCLDSDIIKIEINGTNPESDLRQICSEWNDAVRYSSVVPDLVLDTTRSGFSGEVVRVFTSAVGVPTLSAQFGDRQDLTHWSKLSKNQAKYMIQVNPPADVIPNAIDQLILEMNLTDAAIIFDNNFVMDTKYRNLINSSVRHVIVQAETLDNEIKEQLIQLKKFDFHNFFILGSIDTILKQIEIATMINITSRYYRWYSITSDYYLTDSNRKIHSTIDTNIEYEEILLFKPNISSGDLKELKNILLSTDLVPQIMTAFYDNFLKIGIEAMRLSVINNLWPKQPYHITCDEFNGTNTPERNFDLLSELKSVTENKFSNSVLPFHWGNDNGDHRTKFKMDIFLTTMNPEKVDLEQNIGTWSAQLTAGLNIHEKSKINSYKPLKFYRVVTVINPPLVQYDNVTGKWSGYCIDMLEEIKQLLQFEYEIYAAPDARYGIRNSSTKSGFNGMVNELIERNADIALGSFTIMAERERVIDFTIPYYRHVGISILMLKRKEQTSLFKFLSVLETDVWLCILASYFFTSILMWIFDRYSPYSYQNSKEKYKDDDEKRVFDLKECLWFCMTSLTPQGGGEAPKNLSGRLVAATWWLFGFIIIASYTANLAAFLTVSRLETPIESLDGLSKQYKIQYAPVMNSEAYLYFKRMSEIEKKFYEFWKEMSLNDSLSEVERAKLAVWDYPVSDKYTKIFEAMVEANFPQSRAEAFQRVLQPDKNKIEFAYIGEANIIRYLAMTSCEVIQIGEEFSKKPYGIGLQKGSPLREPLNDAIVYLRNNSRLSKLEKKWWDDNENRKTCPKIHNQSDGISIDNIGGVFLVICGGIILACVTLSIEYWYYCYRHRKKIQKFRNMKPRAAWLATRRFNINQPIQQLSIDTFQSRF